MELRLLKLTALGINEIEIEIKKLSELIIGFKIFIYADFILLILEIFIILEKKMDKLVSEFNF